jgi:hypothetical protein
MRAAHMVLAFALLAGLAGCRKGPQGDTGPRRTSGAKGRYGTGGSARPRQRANRPVGLRLRFEIQGARRHLMTHE